MNRARLTILIALAAALTACGSGPSAVGGSPSATAAGATGREVVVAFFDALRDGDVDRANRYVRAGALDAGALRELARRGEAVSARVRSGHAGVVRVRLTADQPLKYWPPCTFAFELTAGQRRIAAEQSCPAPRPSR